MKKSLKVLITIVIAIALMIISSNKIEAANFTLSHSDVTLEIGGNTSITINASTHTGRINITSSDSNVATVNTGSLWVENNSQTITISAKNSGTATITLSGDLYDTEINAEKAYTKTISVIVNKMPEPEPKPEPQPQPEPTPDPVPETPVDPEPETPPVEETPNFTETNKTMYASKDMFLRDSWSTKSGGTKISKGTELKVIATSNNMVNKYVWYKVSYNGEKYAASNLLTETKPEDTEEPTQDEPTEEPADETPVEDPITHDENEVKDGLKSLEIEGLTLSPAFSPDVYEYRVIVKEDLSELVINAEPASEGATITIAGNGNLQEGENLIIIVVYNAQKEVEATYQITTNKNTLNLADTDKMLQMGNKEAKRNAIIFVILLVVEIIVLIVVMILKHRNENKEYEEPYGEKYDENNDKEIESQEEIAPFEAHTESEQNVENIPEKSVQNEQIQDETTMPRREKRKGKHF